jgi:IS605 OrfB family transposase
MSFKGLLTVSLLTLQGRALISFQMGAYQQARMDAIQGQADLLYRDGVFSLAMTIDRPAPPAKQPNGTLGGDLGTVNLATDSDSATFSGAQIEQVRQRMLKLRAALQKRNTKSAKRPLKRLRRRERRFHTNTNHVISKKLVAKARATKRGIAMEDVRPIRQRTDGTVSKSQRHRQASWSFAQLRTFIEYKAYLAGVCLHLVDPRHTSRTCSVCGYCDKAHRKSQAAFVCQSCGCAAPADYNAALNISRAEVKQPIVGAAA